MRAPSATIFTREGYKNVALYKPGERLTPIPGCPIYPDHWTLAEWYPGSPERVHLCQSEKDAEDSAKDLNQGQRVRWSH